VRGEQIQLDLVPSRLLQRAGQLQAEITFALE